MKVLFADSAHPLLSELLEKEGFHCQHPDLNRQQALECMHEFDAVVIRSRFAFDREMLDAATNLKCIGRVGAGMENIDVEYARSKGIACLNVPEGNRNAVAEQVLGMLLMLMNNLRRADQEVRQGIWRREANRGHELEGKTVGIIGLGNNGQAFAKVLRGFELNVLAYDPYLSESPLPHVELCNMERVFNEADVVSLHVPLTNETNYLVNAEWLKSFKKPIWLANAARGKCLNTHDLLDALDSGKVRGAALDVLEFESLSFENTDAQSETLQRLFNHENVVLSPHIAGWTHESNIKMARGLADKMIQVLKS